MDSSEQIIKPKPKFPTITQAWYITLIFFVVTIAVAGALALLINGGYKDLREFLGYTIPLGVVCAVVLMFQKHEFDAKFTTLFRKFDLQIIPFLLLFVVGFGYASDFIMSLFPMPEFMKKIYEEMGMKDSDEYRSTMRRIKKGG